MEDIANAISDILQKWMGKNGWRFWLCAAIVLSFVWVVERNNMVGYCALFSILMVLLLLINSIGELIKRNNEKKFNRLFIEAENLEKKEKEEKQIFEYKNSIWKIFAVVEDEPIQAAISLFSLRIIDKNPLSRFVSHKEINQDSSIWKNICKARQSFQIIRNHGLDTYEMIKIEKNHLGVYLIFDEYLYHLLLWYKENGEKKFL